MSQESIANFDAALPESLKDQLRIVQFLDEATSQIDDLIAKKREFSATVHRSNGPPLAAAQQVLDARA
jgi:hypothetical protein